MHDIHNAMPTINLSDVWDQFNEVRRELETEHEEYLDGGNTGDFNSWLGLETNDVGTQEQVKRYLELKDLVDALERYGFRLENEDDSLLVHDDHIAVWVRDQYMESFPVPDKTWSDMPFCHIDWEAVAKDRASDYSIIEWDGASYYVVEEN